MSRSQEQLIRRVTAASGRATAELLADHWPAVWQTAYAITGRRSLADDAAQATFERALHGIATFDPQRPLWPWLRRIAANCAVDELRRESRLDGRDVPERAAPYAEVDHEIIEAVKTLEPDRRVVVILRYWLDWSVDEIADALDLPEGTVMSRLSRARDSLRVLLEVNHARRT